MYNYLDFFSNKYKIRRQIAKEMKERTSLEVKKNRINKIFYFIFYLILRKLIIF
jgi:hypothetical protein